VSGAGESWPAAIKYPSASKRLKRQARLLIHPLHHESPLRKARFHWFLRRQMGPRKIGAAELTERRFPPPWIVEELEACFYVCDSAGQKLAFIYFEDEPGRRAAAKLLAKDEARRIAANIAKLPELLLK
jgi:hypothetical protein